MNIELLRRRMDKFFANTSGEELAVMLKSRKGGCTACRMVASGVKSRKTLPHTCGIGSITKNIKR